MKLGDFQSLAAGRPMLFFRSVDKARADWEAGWRDVLVASFPDVVAAVDAAVGWPPEEEDEADGD